MSINFSLPRVTCAREAGPINPRIRSRGRQPIQPMTDVLSIPKNPLADMFGRMIFIGVRQPACAPEPATDQDQDDDAGISKTEIVELRRKMGARLREAREELCGLTRNEAAVLLDVPVRSLIQYESATDCKLNEVFMLRASQAYDVSLDWLYGVSDDWERSSRMHKERKTAVWMFHHVERRHCENMEHMKRLYDQHDAMERTLRELTTANKAVLQASERIMATPGFENMRGSAPVAAAHQRLEKSIRQAEATLERIRRGIDFHRISDDDLAELRGTGD